MERNISFEALLANEHPVVLDGGLATELESQGFNLNSKLWSAQLLLSHPEAITCAHLAYLEAGANIITTASYQASIKGLVEYGLTMKQAKDALMQTIVLAMTARDRFLERNPNSNEPLVAASIGPYGAYLADGSEYSGDYGVPDTVLLNFHGKKIEWLDESGADILACETIPSLQETEILADLLANINSPAWVSFSCRNGSQLSDGTGIETAATLFSNHPRVHAIGINCTAPQYIEELIDRIKQSVTDKAVVVYPNSGECYEAVKKSWRQAQSEFYLPSAARHWADQGASIIGGCCRVGPADIAEIARTLAARRT